MKRFIVLCSIVLLLISSCYFSNIEEYSLTVTDNGPSLYDRTKHVVSVKAPEGYSTIRYTVGDGTPTSASDVFSPSSIQASDTLIYDGILVSEGSTFKAVAYSGGTRTLVAAVKIEKVVSCVPVVTNNGILAADASMCILSLSVDDGSVIYYTTDGSDPRTGGTEYRESRYLNDADESVRGALFEVGVTVMAASKKGNAWSDVVEEKAYSTSRSALTVENMGELSSDSTKQIISFSCSLENPTIYYKLDGCPENVYSGTEYTNSEGKTVSGIAVSTGTTVTAYAKSADKLTPEMTYVVYTADELKPVMVNHGSYKADRTCQIVQLATPDRYAKIYYTVDGSDPKSGILYEPKTYVTYSGERHYGITIPPTAVFRAVAVDGQMSSTELDSSVESTSSWAPLIENKGEYNNDASRQKISITSSDSSAEIYYTLDGSDPKYGTLYSSQIIVDTGKTVRTVAKKGEIYSEESVLVVRETFSWSPTITYYGPSPEKDGKEVVAISTNYYGYSIYYTVDGSDPYDGTLYAPYECKTAYYSTVNGILVDTGTTVRAIARMGGSYSKDVTRKVDYRTEIQPKIEDRGTYRSDTSKRVVTLSCKNANASIYYTLDGQDPSTDGTLYDRYISWYTSDDSFVYGMLVPSGTEIKVVAKYWDRYSDVVSRTVYSPSDLKPGYTILGADASDGDRVIVSLKCIAEDAEILYTTDSTGAEDNGKKYVASFYTLADGTEAKGISIAYGTELKAVALRDGLYSDELSLTLTVPAPEIVDYGGVKVDDTVYALISLSRASSSTVIYYTTDDTDPKTNGTVYEESSLSCSDGIERSGIIVSSGSVIRAVAKNGEAYSAEFKKVIYNPGDWTPEIRNLGGAEGMEGYQIISMSSKVSSNSIYYTTDGLSPKTAGTTYSSQTYLNTDGERCYGVLIPVGSTLRVCSKDGIMYSDDVSAVIYSSSDIKPSCTVFGEDGTDEGRVIVSLSSADPDADILYTTDGTTDPKSGSEYTPEELTLADGSTVRGVSIAYGTQLRVVARDALKLYSDEFTTALQIEEPRLIGYGVLKDDDRVVVVSLSGASASDTILYTTDTNDPKTQGMEYMGTSLLCADGTSVTGIKITSGTTLRAVVQKGDTYSPEFKQVIYSPDKWTPTIENLGTAEGHEGYQVMALSPYDSTDSIYYTVDGSDPRTAGILYEAVAYTSEVGETLNGVLVATGAGVKACSKDGDMYSDAVEATAEETSSWAPTFVNNGGSNGYQIVTMTSTEPDVTIHYAYSIKTNSKKTWKNIYSPKDASLSTGETVQGISISGGLTIWAVAKKGDIYSDTTEFYVADTISWEPKITTLGPYQLNDSEEAKIISLTTASKDNCTIYYTTDGTDPRSDGIQYMGSTLVSTDGMSYIGIPVSYGKEIRCVAKKTVDGKDIYSDVVLKSITAPSITVNTTAGDSSDYRWIRYSSYDVSDCICYKSTNEKCPNSKAVMKITFSGTSFTIYIRSYAEQYCDYTIASVADPSSIPESVFDTSVVKSSTRYKQTSGKALSDYTKVTYDGLSDGEHSIYVVFAKSGSNDYYDDCGYVLIPSSYL